MNYTGRPSFLFVFIFLRTEEYCLHIETQICSTSGGHLLFFCSIELHRDGRAQSVPGTMHVFHRHINDHGMSSSFVLTNRTAFLSQVPEPHETIAFYQTVTHDNLTSTKLLSVQKNINLSR